MSLPSSAPSRWRLPLQGVLLFLFIPLVLFLYLRLPLGPGPSLGLGLALMFGHRVVAAPWMARHATERCLWCGRTIDGPGPLATDSREANRGGGAANDPRAASEGGETSSRDAVPSKQGGGTDRAVMPVLLDVRSGGRRVTAAACGPSHRRLAGRFLTFVNAWRIPIALGIFVPLTLLLASTTALALGRPFMPQTWAVQQFRVVVALTVVGVSIAYLAVRTPREPLVSPFPLHNLFLLGIRNTLWVFRVVGFVWLAGGAWSLVAAICS